MPYAIKFIENNRIIQIKNNGELSYEELLTQTREVIKIQQEKSTSLILTEFVSVKLDVNIADIFQFPEVYEQLGMQRKNKIAVVVSDVEIKTDELQFYETICLNRGWNIKIFLKEKEAIKWLLSESIIQMGNLIE